MINNRNGHRLIEIPPTLQYDNIRFHPILALPKPCKVNAYTHQQHAATQKWSNGRMMLVAWLSHLWSMPNVITTLRQLQYVKSPSERVSSRVIKRPVDRTPERSNYWAIEHPSDQAIGRSSERQIEWRVSERVGGGAIERPLKNLHQQTGSPNLAQGPKDL